MNNPKFPFLVIFSLNIIFVLSSSVTPHRYWLELSPNLEINNFTFNGNVKIDFSLINNTGVISLRSKNLTIIEDKTYLEATYIWGWRRVSVKHEYTKDNLILKIINETLTGSNYYRLSLYYIGTLNNKNIGFYRKSYLDSNNKTRWIAATNFQPDYPHYAFPCFSDYFETKAPFQISLRRTKNQTVWSSTSPIYRETSESSDGKILRSYDWSPNLSPNELVFVVGEHPNATCPVWTAPDVPN